MLLTHTFTVGIPVDEAWRVLLDLRRIAPCLPGAALTAVEGEDYHGGVKVKVGPVTARYEGVARFEEVDEQRRRAVLEARGKDTGGQGNARARITLALNPQGEGTMATIDTDLELSGRVAQFGRGVISDVTSRLIGQFVKNLEAELSRPPNTQMPAVGAPGPAAAPNSLDVVEPLDVMGSMSGVLIRYAVPAVGGALLLAAGAAWVARSWRRAAAMRTRPTVAVVHLVVHASAPGIGKPAGGALAALRADTDVV